jgi:DNA polymerase IV
MRRDHENESQALSEERLILHADMDAFFASVEVRERPELLGLPVIVGGLSGRGVVSAASYAAREFGVRSAMPIFEARRLCPAGVYLPPNMELYAKVSSAVHQVFLEFTSEIEPIALDEAFLDITHSLALFGDPLEIGRQLRRRVTETTRLTVSVGIASSKLVAKVACTSGKPDGLVYIERGKERDLLKPLPIRRLWGIGPVSAAALEKCGIRTIGQLACCPLSELERLVGNRAAEVIELANGRDVRRVEVDREPKSYGEECTFDIDLMERTRILETITAHSEAVARRLRHDDHAGRTITLKVKLSRVARRRPDRLSVTNDAPEYPQLTRARTIGGPTNDGAEIRRVALALWDELALKEPIRLLGVSVSKLQRAESGQLGLFDQRRPGKQLGATLDAIEARFGRGAIHRGTGAVQKSTPSATRKRGE